MIIPHANPRERDAELFMGQLHQELAAGERVELRYQAPGEDVAMRRAFFADPAEAARTAVRLGQTHDVYVGAATRRGEDGTKKGVRRVRALWADLDFKGGRTIEDRLEQLTCSTLQPSILVRTGGGLHAYWLLEEPAEGPEEMETAELAMRLLAEGLAGDPVHDRSRIMRMPGTFNHKYGEPRPVTLEECNPDARYGIDRLGVMAEALADEVEDGNGNGGSGIPRRVLSSPIREGNRNATLASVAGSLRARGLDADTICAVLVGVNIERCEPPLEEAEVIGVGRSIGKYPTGSVRYKRSSARRIYGEEAR